MNVGYLCFGKIRIGYIGGVSFFNCSLVGCGLLNIQAPRTLDSYQNIACITGVSVFQKLLYRFPGILGPPWAASSDLPIRYGLILLQIP